MLCKICGRPSSAWSKALILKKHTVQYFCCEQCGFIQTEDPYWLDESYADAIARNDIGMASRNIAMTWMTQAIILSFFDCNARFIDYGGGYGLLVRLMRDRGLDFYRYDKYAPNLFAQGFEADKEENHQYEVLTAFEVFEHLPNPLDKIRQMLRLSRSILFTTILVPAPPPALDAWWYYSLDHGQHVALYTLQSLKVLAQKLNLNLYSNQHSIHLLTDKILSQTAFRFISHGAVSRLANFILRKRLAHRSLLPSDYMALTGKSIS
jgi:2-polyprenyl-3-methyl-5-hydroxy-6-metoxy-1,4-benzoquinol methylase